MSLEARVRRLEDNAKTGGHARCQTCANWPDVMLFPPEHDPVRCPDCGWEPSLTIFFVKPDGAAQE